MNAEENILIFKVYLRLILFWVICESLITGLLPGQIPFIGIIKTGLSVFCISLIGYFVPKRGSIILATIIVLIFKILVHPYVSLNACISVLFQGILGQLLFSYSRYYRLSCVLLATTVITGAAIQNVITRTILSDADFLVAVNDLFHKKFQLNTSYNYTFWIITGYFIIHVLAGIAIGILTANSIRVVRRTQKSPKRFDLIINTVNTGEKSAILNSSSKAIHVLLFATLLIILFLPLFASAIRFSKSTSIMLRALFTFYLWSMIAVPLLENKIVKYMKKHKQHPPEIVKQSIKLLPEINNILTGSWQLSAQKNGFSRFSSFVKIAFFNFVQTHVEPVNEWA